MTTTTTTAHVAVLPAARLLLVALFVSTTSEICVVSSFSHPTFTVPSSSSSSSLGFTATSPTKRRTPSSSSSLSLSLPLSNGRQQVRDSIVTRFAETNKDDDDDDAAAKSDLIEPSGSSPFEEGSHEELMYTCGINLARQMGDVRLLVESKGELTCVAKGILDSVVGKITDDGQRALLQTRGKDLNTLLMARAAAIRQKLKEFGEKMLREMAETEGAVRFDSGVVLHVVDKNPGGQLPTVGSTVKVHYHGTLPDGTIFDSTLLTTSGDEDVPSEPATFALGQVISGWREGLLKMHEGETAMLGIPPQHAYGEQGTPDGRVPGESTLFFKVTLLEVLTAGIGGEPTLLGADGKKLKKGGEGGGSGLVGVDGKPL